jgi:carboxypeptidase Taq
MREALEDLKRHLAEISDLESVGRLLEWDECVYMPARSAGAHARQKTTLARLTHERLTSPTLGRLLEKLALWAEDLPHDSDDASLIRVTKREYDRALQIPSAFVTRLEGHKARCYDAWCLAREENDFSVVAPLLQRGIDLSREYAGFFPGYQHVADPLIETQDHGVTVSNIRPVFNEMRRRLLPLLQAVINQPEPDDSFLYRKYPKIKQLRFGQSVIERCGFDFMRGRQDLSLHPFATNMSLDDVRITTNVNEFSFFDSFSSTLHEAGHAIYEQRIPAAFEASPLAKVTSIGLHESQARLWENVIGRSREFWTFFFPILKAVFPDQLEEVTVEQFHRGINRVKPSLQRTEADELTYNLHVMIRFDLEVALLEGTLAVEDLPEAWNERYRTDLNVVPQTCSEGVLQDVHWYCDLFGGEFQSYALGNLISAACFDCARKEYPAIASEIEAGAFGSLLNWLNDHVYRHGSKLTAGEVVRSFCGDGLPLEPYFRYLYSKYSGLYDLAIEGYEVAEPEEGASCATSASLPY